MNQSTISVLMPRSISTKQDHKAKPLTNNIHQTLKMTSAQFVETSVTNNSCFQNHPHPDDHTIRTTDTAGFQPFSQTSSPVFPWQTLKRYRNYLVTFFQRLPNLYVRTRSNSPDSSNIQCHFVKKWQHQTKIGAIINFSDFPGHISFISQAKILKMYNELNVGENEEKENIFPVLEKRWTPKRTRVHSSPLV